MTDAEKLADAKEALHQLLTGTRVVELTDQNGEKVVYNRLNLARLQAYIESLERTINPATGGPLQIYL